MAADIILCRPTHLCVGMDQNKHVEYTRHVIRKFNMVFKFKTACN